MHEHGRDARVTFPSTLKSAPQRCAMAVPAMPLHGRDARGTFLPTLRSAHAGPKPGATISLRLRPAARTFPSGVAQGPRQVNREFALHFGSFDNIS